jgi:hypothetical protein
MADYYKLTDLETVAKHDGKTAYLFDFASGNWEMDTNSTLAQRLAQGTNGGKCERITQEEAQMVIGHEEDGSES